MSLRRTIHLKLAAVVSLGALLVSIAAATVVYRLSYAETVLDSERDLANLMGTVEKTAAVAAFTGNVQIADDVVSSLSRNHIVHYVRLTGERQLDMAMGERSLGNLRTLKLQAPFNEKELIGTLEVELDASRVAEKARTAANHAAMTLLALSMAVAMLVYAAVYWMLSRPLSKLSHLLHDIIPGSPERLPSLGRQQDELVRLSEDINGLLAMVQTMVIAERNIRAHSEEVERRFRGIFERASIGIVLVNEEGRLLLTNPAFHLLIEQHLPVGDELGQEWMSKLLLNPQRLWARAIESREGGHPVAEDMETQRGWIHMVVAAGQDDHGQATYQCLFYDISERRAKEEVMRRRADYDQLTGLMNRGASETRFGAMIEEANMSRGRIALLLIDLDRFKHINDTYGHDAGDRVLVEVAQRMRKLLRRETDILARLGGDEFMMVLGGVNGGAMVANLAEKLIRNVSEPIHVTDTALDHVGASVGISMLPEHGLGLVELRNRADHAMYLVKRYGRNGYAVYDPQTPDDGQTVQHVR